MILWSDAAGAHGAGRTGVLPRCLLNLHVHRVYDRMTDSEWTAMADDVNDILRQIAKILPTLATKDDVAALRSDISSVKSDVSSLDRRLTSLEETVQSHRAETRAGFATMDRRVTTLEETVESHRAETRKGFANMDQRIRQTSEVAEVKGCVEEHSQMLQLLLAGRMSRNPAA